MSNENIIKQRGTLSNYRDDRGSAILYPHPIIGIVKNNIDNLRSGKIQVYLKRLNEYDENDPDNWTTVRYSSPFFGYTPNTGSPNSDGTFTGNRNSYGFWATPPDIGTEVICVFINGDPSLGYYVGNIPPISLTHMVPAIGSAKAVIPNAGEAEGYGGASVLPVTEYNDVNKGQDNSSTPNTEPRPIHSYQAAILNKQGLIRDPARGVISSSSTRESPSRVFGMSTPGRPIYKGGYGGEGQPPIEEAIKNTSTPAENFQVTGRLGGHSIVMDDGDLLGKDQLLRFRTSTGHMILMSDTAQTLFIIHSNGQSYIELGKEGTIDMYATNSVNIRTQGDLNLHADNNININAANQLSISAKTLKTQSIDSTTQYTGTTFEQYTKGNHTLKVNSKMSFESKGESSLKSGGTNYINGGPNIMLNSGSGSLNPEEVKQLPITAHYDTLYDSSKGYVSTPDKLQSIVSRAPTHSPWEDANKGVNVKTNLDAGANLPAAPSPSLESVNQSTQNASVTTTTPSVTATVPQVSNASNNLDQGSTVALASQLAVNAGNGPAKDAIATNAGVVSGANGKMASLSPYGLNPSQLVATGYLKPGTDVAINKLINEGKTLDEAMPDNCWTGKDGITSTQSFLNSKQAQSNAAVNLISQGEKSMIDAGIITGNESPTQTGGVILSAVSAGVASTVDYVKTSASSAISVDAPITSPTVNSVTNVSASSLSGVISPYAIKPSNAIASGNNATAMADSFKTGNKSKSNFSLKGSVAGLFNKAVSKFKSLKPNIPQKLTGVISDAGDKALDKTLASTLGTGGPVNIKIASAIKNSFNSGALSAQSTKLLGDKGIPPLAFDATSTTPKEQSAEGGKKYDTLKAELTKLDDDKWVLRKKYYDAKKIYGDSSPEAQAAEADYKKCLQRIEEVRKEMFKASTS
jgi:hypothetical protein